MTTLHFPNGDRATGPWHPAYLLLGMRMTGQDGEGPVLLETPHGPQEILPGDWVLERQSGERDIIRRGTARAAGWS